MAARELSEQDQDDIVTKMAVEVETLSGDEFEALYDQLDAEHKAQAMEDVSEFANNAVGDEHWNSDETG